MRIASAMKLAKKQRIIVAESRRSWNIGRSKTLPIEQMDSFLREARDSGVFEMYYVELATGFRRGQLLGLKWEDIDFEHDNLQVKRQIARINDEIVKAHRKSKNAYRTLPQAEDTIQVLKQQRKKTVSSP